VIVPPTFTAGVAFPFEIELFGDKIGVFGAYNYILNQATEAYNQTATGVKVVGFATGANLAIWPKTGGAWSQLGKYSGDDDLNPPQDVLYIGGSITGGGSSTDPFTLQLPVWLMASYPQKKYINIVQSYGGRTSWTQLVHMADIVATNPKLIFVDYAVNDSGNVIPESAEALVRVLRTKLPNAVITVGIFTWPDNYSHMDAARRAARDLWKELITRYSLQTGDNFATDICTLEGHTEATIPDADVEKYLPAVGDMHPNDLGHSTISNGFETSLATILPALASQWTPPLPTRYIANSVSYEYDPIIRNGIDNDGETGAGWSTSGTARLSSTANDTIKWTGTFSSFGLDCNYGGGAGTVAWDVDGGGYTNLDLTNYLLDLLISSFARGTHTVTLKVISGTVRINKFEVV
jgi:hypothetical protein